MRLAFVGYLDDKYALLQLLLERMMGLEPTTFCMASRRSSQLSYIRVALEQYLLGLLIASSFGASQPVSQPSGSDRRGG